MAYFLSFLSLSDELKFFLSLIVRVGHFPILGKNFPQTHSIIVRERPQNNIIHKLRYFSNFPLTPFI